LTIFGFFGFFYVIFFFGFFLDFFWIFWIFFWNFSFFWIFLDFFLFFFVYLIVTKGTSKCYHGYYLTPKIAKNWPKQHKKLSFFCLKGKKKPLPKPSAGARNRPA
jgi:hypothetical protein